MVRLICPVCKSILRGCGESHRCDPCQKDYESKNGIVYFNETEHYYGELPRKEMQEFLTLAETSGWKEAVTTYLPKRNPALMKTITDPRRTTWVSLLNLKGDETALDFGCGLGGGAVPLSGSVKQVVAMDGCYDRIRFLQIRRDQEKLKDIFLVCHGKVNELPFPDASFDLIVLNMVFPYLAAALPQYDIPVADEIIFREMLRTLKPDGYLYLSIRNKYCFHRVKAMVFPEPAADNFIAHGPGYYRNLLVKSGMTAVKSFWPIPSYKYPEYFVPLDGDVDEINRKVDGVQTFSSFKKTAVRTLNRIGKMDFLAETISFVARKK